LAAAIGLVVVTMFQPARPLLRWSSVAKRRARSHGDEYVVEAVASRPTWLVVGTSAASRSIGS
jgi:hypothetical protein